jgi:uncharacterized membrane protein YbaN (DUF454 family)
MVRFTQLFLWRLLALLALATGLVGLALPVLPTVPFLILAAWAAGKSSPALERWLLTHPRHGPHIRAWRERGTVPRRAKWFATLAMIASAVMLQFTPAPIWGRIGIPTVMTTVAIWLWLRPEQ